MKKPRQAAKKNHPSRKGARAGSPRRISEDDLTSVAGGSVKGALQVGLKTVGEALGTLAGVGGAILDGVSGGGLPPASHWNGGKGPRG
jgi:hypothetical protein